MQAYPLLRSALVSALAGVVLLTACSGEPPPAPDSAAQAAPSVTVLTVQAERVAHETELPGRTTPFLIAEVRPQVTGIVLQRNFDEGSEVQADQLLYQIDPAPYKANYDSATAGLARAEADLYAVRLKAERFAELVKTKAISTQANDDAVAALMQAQANVAAAQATLAKAKIDLDFTQVKAPIAGRIGRSAVTPGALVTANQAATLAIVQQLDPIYVDLTQSSAELLRLRRDLASGKMQRTTDNTLPVKLLLEDGSEYAADGTLAFSEVTVDETTGSVTLRAVFPNPKNELLPGMYVRARLSQGVQDNAILVPHAALTRDPKGNAVVMVIGVEDKVEARTVQT
ncbi:MAG TPA: efflux RND transporter periplasmic adaptor subunit, partial [Gammaproteobacteria bacterium]|nr:efflux RND transporter periplasmic adaptor subunit [Gammaproteobacteria bacterium]